MHETDEDLRVLQALLDRSYARAGAHLTRILTPERRVPAGELVARLQGMCLLSVATVSARGVRARHLRRRSAVSANHLPGEEFAVTVHGRAVPIDVRAPEGAGLRATLLEIYAPRYGTSWEHDFLDGGRGDVSNGVPCYWRIEPERMFSFRTDPES